MNKAECSNARVSRRPIVSNYDVIHFLCVRPLFLIVEPVVQSKSDHFAGLLHASPLNITLHHTWPITHHYPSPWSIFSSF